VDGGYATVAGVASVSFVSFWGSETSKRLGGDKKDGDERHLEQRNKKTSVVVDVVTTSVETGGRLRRRRAPGGHCGDGAESAVGAGNAGAPRLSSRWLHSE
jgi:hypothetical protein